MSGPVDVLPPFLRNYIIRNGWTALKPIQKRTLEIADESGCNILISAGTSGGKTEAAFFPILTLTGIEGKYFTPMAKTLVFCIIGALLLSLTYVPMMSSLFLSHHISSKPSFADRFFAWLNRIYQK